MRARDPKPVAGRSRLARCAVFSVAAVSAGCLARVSCFSCRGGLPLFQGDSPTSFRKRHVHSQLRATDAERNSWNIIVQGNLQKAEWGSKRKEQMKIATYVPKSFEDAIDAAAAAISGAREAGVHAQRVCCSVQGSDEEAFLEEAIEFTELISRRFLELDDELRLQIVFPDVQLMSDCANAWELPPAAGFGHSMQLSSGGSADGLVANEWLGASLVMFVAPGMAELPAIRALRRTAEEFVAEGRAPASIVLINPPLPIEAEDDLTENEDVVEDFSTTFYLEQLDLVDGTGTELNSLIVTSAWPRGLTLWEDNPVDPDEIDGYYFHGAYEKDTRPSRRALQRLLESSRAVFKERCKWKA